MSREINLSPRKRADVVLKQKKLTVFRRAAIIFFGVVAGITAIVFLLNIFSPVNGLKKERETLLAQLSSQNKKLSKYVFIRNRLQDVSDILDKRGEYNKIIQQLVTSVPQDAKIDALKIEANKVNVTVTASSLSSINSFIDSIVGLTNSSQIFKRAVLEDLASDTKNGRFNLVIKLDTL